MRNDPLTAGDTLDFEDVVAGYPPSDGWVLKYRLVPSFTAPSQSPIEITASGSGSTYRVQAAPAVTATWQAGLYHWASWVEKTGARWSVESGSVTVLADPATRVAGYDARSDAKKIYDGLIALHVDYASGRGLVAEYTIAGRTMKFRDAADLLKQIAYWKAQVEAEDRAERIKAGQDSGATLRVRF